jgi:DNA-binding NarL/FixJ family response regulator
MTKQYTLVIFHNNLPLIENLMLSLTDTFSVYSAPCGKNFFKILSHFPRPDIILLILESTRDHENFFSISRKARYKDIPVIVISSSTTLVEQVRVHNHGAIDCISIPFNSEALKAKILSIIRFKEDCLDYFSIKIETEIMKSLEQLEYEEYDRESTGDNIYLKYHITLREREIIELLGKGLLNKEISDMLNVSKRTVEFHINNIYQKFNVKNRFELLKKINKQIREL